MKKLFTIDGGGGRATIAIPTIISLETRIKRLLGDPYAHLSDFVDYFAGTSSGAIISSLLNVQGVNGRPKYTANDVLDLYLEHLPRIFKTRVFRRLGFLWFEKYSKKHFVEMLEEHLGDITTRQTINDFLIPAYDFTRNENVKFTRTGNEYLLRDVVEASASAPYYFKPSKAKNDNGLEGYYIDGGISVNNIPTIAAHKNARRELSGYSLADDLVVSLGSGYRAKQLEFKKVNRWGAIKWGVNAPELMLVANMDEREDDAVFMYEEERGNSNYYRLQPALFQASSKMDLTTKGQLNALVQAGREFVDKNDHKLEEIAKKLIQ